MLILRLKQFVIDTTIRPRLTGATAGPSPGLSRGAGQGNFLYFYCLRSCLRRLASLAMDYTI